MPVRALRPLNRGRGEHCKGFVRYRPDNRTPAVRVTPHYVPTGNPALSQGATGPFFRRENSTVKFTNAT